MWDLVSDTVCKLCGIWIVMKFMYTVWNFVSGKLISDKEYVKCVAIWLVGICLVIKCIYTVWNLVSDTVCKL